MVDQVSIINHNAGDVCKLYDHSDPQYQDYNILSEHYFYHKPHNVRHSYKSDNWTIIQCLFGVCRFEAMQNVNNGLVPKEDLQISRENKTQVIVPPGWVSQWDNISGKAVVTVKECTKN